MAKNNKLTSGEYNLSEIVNPEETTEAIQEQPVAIMNMETFVESANLNWPIAARLKFYMQINNSEKIEKTFEEWQELLTKI